MRKVVYYYSNVYNREYLKSIEVKLIARISGLSGYSKCQKVDLMVALTENCPLLQIWWEENKQNFQKLFRKKIASKSIME